MFEIILLLVLTAIFCSNCFVDGQNGDGKASFRGSRRGPRRQRREKDRPIDLNFNNDENTMMKSLTINYPLHIFSPNGISDWRKPGHFSSDLEKVSSNGKPYKELARAQDQEDVWLYENWFYGVENGIILESGALNGIIFSTSYMFEKFANWTAIHVGLRHS